MSATWGREACSLQDRHWGILATANWEAHHWGIYGLSLSQCLTLFGHPVHCILALPSFSSGYLDNFYTAWMSMLIVHCILYIVVRSWHSSAMLELHVTTGFHSLSFWLLSPHTPTISASLPLKHFCCSNLLAFFKNPGQYKCISQSAWCRDESCCSC